MKRTDEQYDRNQQSADVQKEAAFDAAGTTSETEREFWLDVKYSDDKLESER